MSDREVRVPGEPGSRGAGSSKACQRSAAGAYWFPLVLFGALAGLSLPLSVLLSPQLLTGTADFALPVYPTVTQAMYLGGGAASGPFPFPLGWYWVALLVTGSLLTAAWYRRRDRRTGSRTPLRAYLVTGLALAAATAALPCVAWGAPAGSLFDGGWAWLDAAWRLGTFALIAVAAGLGVLTWVSRSRALAAITILYIAAVCLAGWINLQQVTGVSAAWHFGADPAALLPAAVLLVAGLGALTVAGGGALRARRRDTGL